MHDENASQFLYEFIATFQIYHYLSCMHNFFLLSNEVSDIVKTVSRYWEERAAGTMMCSGFFIQDPAV